MLVFLVTVSLALSVVALLAAFRRVVKLHLTIQEAAAVGVDAAIRCCPDEKDRARFATEVVLKLDTSIDGRQDWTPAQARLAVEAEMGRRK